ncbi:MAG: hypothetical protein FWH27_11340 [Planctomycetaceae bacterium]|nr:hypothetical protein [Planctomycetaceae bacterium]
MRTLITTILIVSGALVCIGCNQGKVPEELKNLVPVTVTVTDGSNPVEGVAVALNSKDGAKGFFVCTGTTDSNGAAQILSTRSSFTGKGVPAGTYSVVLVKPAEIPEDLQPQEEDQDNPAAAAAKQAKRDAFLKQNQTIPVALTQSTASPVELTVAEKTGATFEIDIAKYR